MHTFDIDIKNLSKIEGHTHMSVKVKKGKVLECKLKVSENHRFYKKMSEGMKYNLVPQKMSRICGTCSVAHALCAIEATEKAFGVKTTKQTLILRRLLMNSSHLRDHAMHLYFFCLPDLYGHDSVFDFDEADHEIIHEGLAVKDAGNYLSTIVGGRAIHPPFMTIGGFTNFPKKVEIRKSIKKLKDVREKVLKIIRVFYENKKCFSRPANYVAMINNDYNYIKGHIKTKKGTVIREEEYGNYFEKVIVPYSKAQAVKWESKDFMVGALARLNINKKSLHKNTKRDCATELALFPSDCVFQNNLAQAIEMLQAVDISLDLLDELSKSLKKEALPKIKPKAGVGVGVLEAPRGTLYYRLEFDSEGIVKQTDLCIPTEQNIIHMEKDLKKYIEDMLKLDFSKKEISLEVEKMIRAYDPCMSCATHFLKIDWD